MIELPILLFTVYLNLSIAQMYVYNTKSLINNEIKRLWKEAVMASFKVQSRVLLQNTEEKHKNFSRDSQSLGRNLNLRLLTYETSVNHLNVIFGENLY